jgi:hypothetical protein
LRQLQKVDLLEKIFMSEYQSYFIPYMRANVLSPDSYDHLFVDEK